MSLAYSKSVEYFSFDVFLELLSFRSFTKTLPTWDAEYNLVRFTMNIAKLRTLESSADGRFL